MTFSREEMDTESCLGRRELNILFLLAAKILNNSKIQVVMGNSEVTEARAPPESVTSPAPSERRALDNIAR